MALTGNDLHFGKRDDRLDARWHVHSDRPSTQLRGGDISGFQEPGPRGARMRPNAGPDWCPSDRPAGVASVSVPVSLGLAARVSEQGMDG